MSKTRLTIGILTIALATGSLFGVLPAHAQSGTWSALDGSATAPSPRREFAAIYDAANQRYLVFGGVYRDTISAYVLFNQVWVLSLAGPPAWSQLTIPGVSPGERHSPQWGYDGARNRLLVFGGYGRHLPGDPYTYLNDVWELSLTGTPEWTELFPIGTPPSGRLAGAAVYDPMRQRFVGFGGTVGTPVDTWVLNLHGQPVWQSLPVGTPRPNGGYGMTSVYDAVGDRMIIFGGSTSAAYYGVHNDVWELKLRGVPSWNRILPTGTPPVARRSGTAIMDPLRNRMIVYSGWSGGDGLSSFLGDTWALSLTGTPQWAELSPAGTIPTGRDVAYAAYDPNRDCMVVYGGWSGAVTLGDTQFLDWGGSGVGAALTPDASATPEAALVEWDVQDATSDYAAVYRRDAGGEWTSIGTAEVGAGNRLTYEDTTVEPGSHYDYMMVIGSERGETFGGEIAVQVPALVGVQPGTGVTFALHRVAPNPVEDRFTASFALPDASPARLSLVDLAGRRVLDHDLGARGPGTHHIELSGARRFKAGMYFLRLEQAGRTASTRIVLAGR